MPDLSIIELVFWGFLELFSISMLIISTIKEIPDTKARSIIRAIYLIPGMIAAAFIGVQGNKVIFENTTTTIINGLPNGTIINNSTTTTINFILLQSEVWGYFHLLIFMVLFIFIINQVYNLLTKND